MTRIQQKIYQAIHKALTAGNGKADWKQISDVVKAEKLDAAKGFKNWLDVRAVVQFCINEGEIARTPDIHVEEYVVL